MTSNEIASKMTSKSDDRSLNQKSIEYVPGISGRLSKVQLIVPDKHRSESNRRAALDEHRATGTPHRTSVRPSNTVRLQFQDGLCRWNVPQQASRTTCKGFRSKPCCG